MPGRLPSFDHEAQDDYSVRICTMDQGNLRHEEALTITVSDVDEPAPVFDAVEFREEGDVVLL